MGCGPNNGHVVALTWLPGDDRLTLRGIQEALVTFARVIVTAGIEGARHAVVNIRSVRVVLGTEWWWPAHLHMSLGRGGQSQSQRRENCSLHFYGNRICFEPQLWRFMDLENEACREMRVSNAGISAL